jgi:hypothetical protein
LACHSRIQYAAERGAAERLPDNAGEEQTRHGRAAVRPVEIDKWAKVLKFAGINPD